MKTLPLLTIISAGLIALGGCGSDQDVSNEAAPTTAAATGSADVSAETDTVPSLPSAPDPPPERTRPSAADVRAAEQAVKNELPDTPIWEGYRFQGRIKNAGLICVDRIPPASEEDPFASHVMVSWPSGQTGEPMDGPCAKAAETAERQARAAQKFFLDSDDDAIALDVAVGDLQNGRAGALAELERLEKRLRNRVNNYADLSYGGNLLLSSVVTAAEEARSEDPDLNRLASVRRDIAEARNSLAQELRD